MSQNFIKKLAIIATVFALVVVLLGAFTRLSHAGLGCPDWPGCYGFKHIPTEQSDIEIANQAFPERPYEFAKAWPEMVHRYFAGTLGLMVLALALLSLKNKQGKARKHSFILLALVTFQAILGMWTVTMKLHPGIVMSHLMGGMMTLLLLGVLSWRYTYQFRSPVPIGLQQKFKKLTLLTLFVLILQIMLGGWTSANYAATICYELPICQGNWLSNSDFVAGFNVFAQKAENYEFGILGSNARIAIHASHRIGAIVASLIIAWLCFRLIYQNKNGFLRKVGVLLSGLLVIQITLGIANIEFQLPLFNAVAHNGVGALLLVVMGLLLASLVTKSTVPSTAIVSSKEVAND
ncbi:MAG: COX15/CtaA family protein [Kangiellaceae bacterium]|nr:COX15/CtaA family protein [Kangiellaceae bacterium]